MKSKYLFLQLFVLGLIANTFVAQAQYRKTTYCNPIDLDYTYPFHNSHRGISYRSGADPSVVSFRGEYYLFVTRSMGYWKSKDMVNWTFIKPQSWYFNGSNAPFAVNYKDSVLYMAGNPSGSMSLLYTDNPSDGDWKPVKSVWHNLQDPAFFIDDDGRSFLYWGSSNKWPIRARELDKNHFFLPKSDKVDSLFVLHPKAHGWERFGENHTSSIKPFLEGAWMNKYKGKYYLQYAAPGTEFNVYGDGVYVSDNPLGPFEYAPNNPICYKPGGFATGAGHGCTIEGPGGVYWHFATVHLSVNYKFERRLCMFPTFFDADGLMHSDTSYGDYPHYAPDQPNKQFSKGGFRGWMLLSYNKPVSTSSFVKGHEASYLVDEDMTTFWSAEHNDDHQWINIDLEQPMDVFALQINFSDYKETNLWGRMDNLRQRYIIETSLDGKQWLPIVDRSHSFVDAPNAYIELDQGVSARYVRYSHVSISSQHLAISDLRVFGKGHQAKPHTPKGFTVSRLADKRDARIQWKPVKGAQGYNVVWGIAPNKLYNSWMIYGDNCELDLRSLNIDQTYYFSVEAFNENGISKRTKVVVGR